MTEETKKVGKKIEDLNLFDKSKAKARTMILKQSNYVLCEGERIYPEVNIPDDSKEVHTGDICLKIFDKEYNVYDVMSFAVENDAFIIEGKRVIFYNSLPIIKTESTMLALDFQAQLAKDVVGSFLDKMLDNEQNSDESDADKETE